jgi:hypothetical protein
MAASSVAIAAPKHDQVLATIDTLEPEIERCYLREPVTSIKFDLHVTIIDTEVSVRVENVENASARFATCVTTAFKKLELPRLGAGNTDAFVKHYAMKG